MSEERRHALIVNPASGRGRGGKSLPDAERLMRARGLSFRTVVSTDLEHGIEQALAAREAGEVPVVMSGDGLVGQIGGALAGGGATMGILPG
ncbi:MAG: diacylglycerol kinase family protein, partial [Solirubrobacterales bacterium]